jgi:putative transposase
MDDRHRHRLPTATRRPSRLTATDPQRHHPQQARPQTAGGATDSERRDPGPVDALTASNETHQPRPDHPIDAITRRLSKGPGEPARIRTAEGAIDVRLPQVRGAGEPFRSSLMTFLDGNSDVLDRLVTEMYARGLSTRDVEDAFRDATGELLISRSAVSEITDQLWEDYQAFIARDLSDIDVEYLFADAIFESLRGRGAKEALLVAWCIDSDGRKHLLHLAVGNKESEAAWTGFFRNLIERGMRMPKTITTDGAPGEIKAAEAVFTKTVRIRCWFHRRANIRSKLPDEAAAEVLAHVYAVRDAPTLDAARAAADRFENTYGREFPAAVACFADDREAMLAIHRVPVRHRIRVRTTNLAERGFEEERRRTKVIPRLMTERATIKEVRILQ